jgi:hypothetical protein
MRGQGKKIMRCGAVTWAAKIGLYKSLHDFTRGT